MISECRKLVVEKRKGRERTEKLGVNAAEKRHTHIHVHVHV